MKGMKNFTIWCWYKGFVDDDEGFRTIFMIIEVLFFIKTIFPLNTEGSL